MCFDPTVIPSEARDLGGGAARFSYRLHAEVPRYARNDRKAQDRIIRLEETLRLQRILSADLQPRIGELRIGQLIGLRFAADEEVPELVRATLNGELRSREDIKRCIKNWRPDTLRV